MEPLAPRVASTLAAKGEERQLEGPIEALIKPYKSDTHFYSWSSDQSHSNPTDYKRAGRGVQSSKRSGRTDNQDIGGPSLDSPQ